MRNREKRLSTYVPQDRKPVEPEPPQTEERQKRVPESVPEPDEDQ